MTIASWNRLAAGNARVFQLAGRLQRFKEASCIFEAVSELGCCHKLPAGLKLVCEWYTRAGTKYKYNVKDNVDTSHQDIGQFLGLVDLEYDPGTKTYSLRDPAQLVAFKKVAATLQPSAGDARNRTVQEVADAAAARVAGQTMNPADEGLNRVAAVSSRGRRVTRAVLNRV